MNTHILLSRSSNGTSISRRTRDGYVNDTAIRRANGKQWPKYRESERYQSYLEALAETSGVRMFDLISRYWADQVSKRMTSPWPARRADAIDA